MVGLGGFRPRTRIGTPAVDEDEDEKYTSSENDQEPDSGDDLGFDPGESSRKRKAASDGSSERSRSSKRARVSPDGDSQDRDRPVRMATQSGLTLLRKAQWPKAWQAIHRALKNDEASKEEMDTLDELFARVYAMATAEDRDVLDPLLHTGFEGNPTGYVSTLNRYVRDQILAWCQKSFVEAMNNASEERRKILNLEEDRKNMLKHCKEGGWPWRADREEIAPLDDNAPPRPIVKPEDKSKSLGFEKDVSPDVDGLWSFSRCLGDGTRNFAGLWVKIDTSNKVVDRKVIKDVYLSPKDSKNDDLWHTPPNGERVPMEVHMQRLLSGLGDSSSIVQYVGHSTPDPTLYRIYQEYCPCGTLEEMIKAHRSKKSWISSHVLWAVFESMASAACLMNYGKLPPPDKRNKWRALIHSDIKPDNIFLTLANDDPVPTWPGVPVAKLGDFDSCHYYDDPDGALTAGTQGYMAPEREDGSGIEYQESHIWTIGRVILSLMNRDALESDDFSHTDHKPGVEQHYANLCKKVVELVEDCLVKKPVLRPTAKQLWNGICKEVGSSRSDGGLALKFTPFPEDQDKPLVGGEGLTGWAKDLTPDVEEKEEVEEEMEEDEDDEAEEEVEDGEEEDDEQMYDDEEENYDEEEDLYS
ncbi:hypothetical protein M409DRAFT_20370 [Zasmidium cellare ATCC 36951]|uniref:non-specific serine/threonine protein kinase n=1 Tax=Zasmidium cellare ATCC 36951 TaxID=1080233 RepID=A0A6A6CPS6_ZASCE|nr:uncharacterized protein M409DRAFT_20370 [Zasmidium cellare ATCC 36951]KAF2169144.1 hypothetical protein M409DRAFT_20370 [Zasmidium cellare ATCC 36951]